MAEQPDETLPLLGDTNALRWAAEFVRAAAREIERLRQWKADATAVLNRWESVFEVVPDEFRSRHLGKSKSSVMLAYIAELASGVHQA